MIKDWIWCTYWRCLLILNKMEVFKTTNSTFLRGNNIPAQPFHFTRESERFAEETKRLSFWVSSFLVSTIHVWGNDFWPILEWPFLTLLWNGLCSCVPMDAGWWADSCVSHPKKSLATKNTQFPHPKCQRSEIQLIFEATKMEDVPRTDLSWSHQQLGLVIQSIPSQHVATRLSWSKLLLRLSNRGCKHPYHFQNWEDPDPRWTSKKTSPIRHERLWTYHLWWRFWPGCLEKSAFVSIDSYISVYATYALLQLDR